MLFLALDTCDARGSIALLRSRVVVAVASHPAEIEYSSWVLPATHRLLSETNLTHSDLDGYVAAAGPGSFTGVRIGLTTVKAWSEIYGKPIYTVSRLSVLAHQAHGRKSFVASCIDAQRRQLFGALYRRDHEQLTQVGEERVTDPSDFLKGVAELTGPAPVSWVSLDPHILTSLSCWDSRVEKGETVQTIVPPLAPLLAEPSLRQSPVDALRLDANYVRRSDAELFGKNSASGNA
jgi:tRNA threonylcarbamoyladenosine biosynthesis protein TsaB